MGIYGLIVPAVQGVAATDAKSEAKAEAAKAVAEFFSGRWETVFGKAACAVFGGNEEHIFGDSARLLISGSSGGLFPALFGKFVQNPAILGVSGDFALNFGAKTDLTYGGPLVQVHRGPHWEKAYHKPLGGASSMQRYSDFWESVGQKCDGHSSKPSMPTPNQATVDPLAYRKELDAFWELQINRTSKLLIVATLAIDLTARLKYGQYDPTTQSLPPLFVTLTGMLTATLCNALYQFEIAAYSENRVTFGLAKATKKIAYVVQRIPTAASRLAAALKERLRAVAVALAKCLYYVVVILLCLIIVGVVLAAAAIAFVLLAA